MSSNPGLPIYLDHNATTPVDPAVVEAILPYLREHFGNPSSGHVYGLRAKQAVELAREKVAALIGSRPDEVIFTSGGTEANNLAIRGVLEGCSRRHIVTSTVEHPATAEPCGLLERQGVEVTRVPVDSAGRVLPQEMRPFVRGDTALITIMLAQNEVGTLMPIAELAEIGHAQGARVHCDAAQAVGKIATDVDELGVDLLSIAGHKLYAPKGVGALYVRRGTAIAPVLLGAGHERGLRPGTENVPYIVGLGEACAIAMRDLEHEAERMRVLRDELWSLLSNGIPEIRLNGHATERLPNTLNVSFAGARGTEVLAGAAEIAASTGSACHAGEESPSAVLLAMGLSVDGALGAVRLSLGRSTTGQDILWAAQSLIRAWRAART